MKKALVYLMLLANLCSGIAFAWDSHPENIHVKSEHGTVMQEGLVNEVNAAHSENNIPQHNDHCAHGAAHLMGVFAYQSAAVLITERRQNRPVFIDLAFPFLYISPLLRPPIV